MCGHVTTSRVWGQHDVSYRLLFRICRKSAERTWSRVSLLHRVDSRCGHVT